MWILSLAAAITIVLAWLNPLANFSAALGWTSAALFIASFTSNHRRYSRAFVSGVILYTCGFYWLLWTIKDFGGFPWGFAIPIFLLFVFGSAVQLIIWRWVHDHLPEYVGRLGLKSALSWCAAWHLWIAIFPWDFAHTQLAFLPFAQAAAIGGSQLVTFLMFWICELILRRKSVMDVAAFAGIAAFVSVFFFGSVEIDALPDRYGPTLRVSVIQGNVSLKAKHNIKYFTVNREHYEEMTAAVSEKDRLIIWPESTITDWVPAETSSAKMSPLLPFSNDGFAYLVGALSFNKQREIFNSAFLIRPDGELDAPYNKRILMPFGEYTPFGDIIPFIKQINATAANFTAGTSSAVLTYTQSSGIKVPLSPLICYEDIVQGPSVESVQKGAGLLVNLTNDAWFGDTVAPYEHHVIAWFRAIENRRFLIRSTNTGYTSVVDPLGQTVAGLPLFTEGTINTEVNLLTERTLFNTWPVELLWRIIAVAAGLSALVIRLTRRG